MSLAEDKVLEFALEETNDGWWDWNVDKNTFYLSPKYWKTFGYDPNTKNHLAQEWQAIIHPDDLLSVQAALEKHFESRGGIPYKEEVRFKNANGSWSTVICRGKVVEWDDQNRPLRFIGVHSDISARKDKELKIVKENETLKHQNIDLSTSKELQDLILENSPDFIFVKDENFKIVLANEAFKSVYPEEQRDKIIGFTTLESYKEDEVEVFLEEDKKAFREGKSEVYEKVTFPDKKIRTLFTQKIRFLDNKGQKFILGLSKDVSKQIQEESLLSELYTITTELDLSAHDRINKVLKKALAYFGLNTAILGEVVSENFSLKNFASRISDDNFEKDKLRKLYSLCVNFFKSHKKNQYVETNNHHSHLKISFSPDSEIIKYIGEKIIVNGRDYGALIVSSELTEIRGFSKKEYSILKLIAQWIGSELSREEIEKKLKKEKEVLEFATEHTNDGWWDWKIQENYEYMSPRFWQTFGVDHKTKKHSPDEWQDLIHPDDLKLSLENFKKHCESKGQHPYYQEVRYKNVDGSYATVICRGKVLEWDKNGEPLRMVGAHTDISELKEKEKKLAESNEELAQFAYRTSHDLKAPLVTIKGLTNFMEEDLDNGDLGEVKKNIKLVHKHACKLEQLVVDILDLAKADLMETKIEEVSVLESINDIIEEQSGPILEKGVEIQVLVDAKVKLYTQKARFNQVLSNLISNSIKYSDPDKDHKLVQIKAIKNDKVTITISDNGVGISRENQEKLFSMFSRFNTDLAEGSGLGMSIVKKSLDALGGQIQQVSDTKETCFNIVLPILNKAS